MASGRRVYVHCTAGINRATLTVVGYLTFVRGWQLDHAVGHVKHRRPIANPYVDCWRTARQRLLEGRGEELKGISRHIYETRTRRGDHGGDSNNDWSAAESQLLREIFERRAEADLSVIRSLQSIWGQQQQQQPPQSAQSAADVAAAVAEEAQAEAEEAAERAFEAEVASGAAAAAAAEEEVLVLQARLAEAEERNSALAAEVERLRTQQAPAAQPATASADSPDAQAAVSIAFMKAAAREMMQLREENELLRRQASGASPLDVAASALSR